MGCSICSSQRQLDRHHIIHKRMGGSRNTRVLAESNLLTLCRRCHRNIHEGGWVITRSETELRVTDKRTGTEVMRRLYRQGFDASAFLVGFTRVESILGDGIGSVAFLDDEQLVEAFRISRTVGKKAWLVQGAVLHEAQRRSVYGERMLVGIARRFEIGIRQAEKYALVWRTFFESDASPEDSEARGNSVNVDAIFLEEPSWYVVAATESPAPHKWLAYAQDRKAENPRYSIGDFRSDIHSVHPPSKEDLLPASDADDRRSRWLRCPWVEPFCTRNGRPIPVEECGCEENGDLVEARGQ
jgi:HNH endonuclease